MHLSAYLCEGLISCHSCSVGRTQWEVEVSGERLAGGGCNNNRIHQASHWPTSEANPRVQQEINLDHPLVGDGGPGTPRLSNNDNAERASLGSVCEQS